MLSDEDINAIKVRNLTRTPGPWVMVNEDDSYSMNAYYVVAEKDLANANAQNDDLGPVICSTLQQTPATVNHDSRAYGFMPWEANAEFIAHAPDDITALLAEVKRLRTLLAQPTVAAKTGCVVCGKDRTVMYMCSECGAAICKNCDDHPGCPCTTREASQ